MKEYSSQKLKDLVQINSDRKKNILMNWIDSEAELNFQVGHDPEQHLRGTLKFFTRYEYIVQFDGQDTISILAKHAVLWIDRI